MQSPSVSVIVPIYKTERFIKRCLQSLFEQTLSDIEYIFVNDCTPDKSMEILSEVLNTSYSHKKPQVKIVSHDKNRGASVARNSGLSAATGQYVIFADSDDWVKQDAYAMMYDKRSNTIMISYGAIITLTKAKQKLTKANISILAKPIAFGLFCQEACMEVHGTN